jgi:hypothetical protein
LDAADVRLAYAIPEARGLSARRVTAVDMPMPGKLLELEILVVCGEREEAEYYR